MDRSKCKPLDRARALGLEWRFLSVNVCANSIELTGPGGDVLPVTREAIDDTSSTYTVHMLLLRTEGERPPGTRLRMRLVKSRTPVLR